jgi:hypothetical protein
MGDCGTGKVPEHLPNHKTVGQRSDLSNRLDIHFSLMTTLAVGGKTEKTFRERFIPTFGPAIWMG